MALAYTNYSHNVAATPQNRPIPGRESEMTPNNAGGYGFILPDWAQLWRFLILGSEGGTYYVGEQKLTEQNATVAIRCIKADGARVVQMAHDVNVNNRAPKVDQQLFVMALVLKHGSLVAKQAAEAALRDMLRIGTHVLHFAAMLDGLGGWSRVKRRIIAHWFENRLADDLAFQVLKYQQRDAWAMRDLLRLSHPSETSPAHREVYRWILGKETVAPRLPAMLRDHALMNSGADTPAQKALRGIEWGLPREALPTEAMADPYVWLALLPQTPPHALLRNLGNLTSSGVLVNGGADTPLVCAKLTDKAAMTRARVHPFAVLLATLVYKQGHGVRGSKTWTPVPAVLSALEDAYDAAFATVEATGKRILIGIDISGSMTASCIGTPIPASTAAAAMAITLARSEPNAVVVQFDTCVRKTVPVTRRTGIAGLESARGGGTDVASPIDWAYSSGHVYDAFIILTDDETWAGKVQPAQVLEAYRRKFNQGAKLVCCSMAANHASVVDPADALSLGSAGLDANIPSIVAEFIRD